MGGQPVDRGVPLDKVLRAHRRATRRAALKLPFRAAGLVLLAAGVLYGIVVFVAEASAWALFEAVLVIAVAVWVLSEVASSRVGRVLHLSWLAEFLGRDRGTGTGWFGPDGSFDGGDCGGGDGGS